jgi:hypothetical protein
MSIFTKIAAGLSWFGKEIGKGLGLLPRLITLADDVEDDAGVILPQTLAVVQDAGNLAVASAKDSGIFLVKFGALTAAIAAAVASKALNVTADGAVVTAFESFCAEFNVANVQDVLTAWDKLADDVKSLDALAIAAIQKLEADAKG